MKERPIIFNGEMVRAILDGRKTQTRRIVKPTRHPFGQMLTPEEVAEEFTGGTEAVSCPFGRVGDRLWVRETFRIYDSFAECACYESCGCARHHGKPVYREDSDCSEYAWTPSIHMPRWASRITLEITGVRIERLMDISEGDAEKEGAGPLISNGCQALAGYRDCFLHLWESIYGAEPLNSNPLVWVVEFRRVEK